MTRAEEWSPEVENGKRYPSLALENNRVNYSVSYVSMQRFGCKKPDGEISWNTKDAWARYPNVGEILDSLLG
jgi:hypothetical protein